MRKPRAIRPGARIRVLSLSDPDAAACPLRFARAKRHLENMGFLVSEGAATRSAHHHMAGLPGERAKDFVEAWFDDEIDGILSVVGGWNTAQLLPLLPWDRLAAAPPKALIGCSDTTSLQAALCAKAVVVCFDGTALMTHFVEVDGLHPYTARHLVRRVVPVHVPVLTGFEIGHVDPVCILPIGTKARLSADALSLELIEPAVV